MKAFIIVLLAFGIVQGLLGFLKDAEAQDGAGIIASLLHIASYILGIVFTCKL